MKYKILPVFIAVLLTWGCKSEDEEPAPTEPPCKTCATYVKEWHDSIGVVAPIEYTIYPNTYCNHEWDTLEGRSSSQIVPVNGGYWKYEMVIHCQ